MMNELDALHELDKKIDAVRHEIGNLDNVLARLLEERKIIEYTVCQKGGAIRIKPGYDAWYIKNRHQSSGGFDGLTTHQYTVSKDGVFCYFGITVTHVPYDFIDAADTLAFEKLKESVLSNEANL